MTRSQVDLSLCDIRWRDPGPARRVGAAAELRNRVSARYPEVSTPFRTKTYSEKSRL